MTRDHVYQAPRDQIVDFVFDEAVARAFPDMIRRSVPGYETVVPLTGLIAARYAVPGTHLYDLGCSLGATSLAMLRYLDAAGCTLIAVDNAEAMVGGARSALEHDSRATVVHADIRDTSIENASVVVMNYTLQFVSPADRGALLARIRRGLVASGVLVLSEKVRLAEADEQAEMDALHLAWKKANGYSHLEIAQKRTALENVLIADTVETHLTRLRDAGFSRVTPWFSCLNWASILACP